MLTGGYIGLGDAQPLKNLFSNAGLVRPTVVASTLLTDVRNPSTTTGGAANAAAQPSLFNPAASPPPAGPNMLLLVGGGAAALLILYLLIRHPSPASAIPVHQNPRRRRNPERLPMTSRLRSAVDKYESFHWGERPSRFVKKKVSRTPKVGVKLGKLVSVAYETTKDGERAVWEHEFGEDGGKRPDLVMDADTEKLHIVGGSYTVRPEGIVD